MTSERVRERILSTGRVLGLTMPVPGVVTVRGSFLTAPDFAAGDELLQELTVALLDQGTKRFDRFEMSDRLERRGAEMSFHSTGIRCGFRVRCLSADVEEVLALVRESLEEPAFDAEQLDLARARLIASVRRGMERTGVTAMSALRRQLFEPRHPEYSFEPHDQMERLGALTRDDVVNFHARHFGANDLLVVCVGDVEDATHGVERVFEGWPPTGRERPTALDRSVRDAAPGEHRIDMADKSNVDVRLGHTLGVDRSDSAFVPLYVANYVLGGNFSARLMRHVRDERGLTYGIGSSIAGVSCDYSAFWRIQVTLSHENLDEGLSATRSVLADFAEGGVTEKEVELKRETIAGEYAVGLATTGGLAATLLTHAERGFPIDYVDRFPDEVRAVEAATVNRVIADHLSPDRLITTMAGTRPASSGMSSGALRAYDSGMIRARIT